jgi:hypothetical protein
MIRISKSINQAISMPDLPKHSRETTNSPMLDGSPTVDNRLALGSQILNLADNLAHWSESTGALTCTFFPTRIVLSPGNYATGLRQQGLPAKSIPSAMS